MYDYDIIVIGAGPAGYEVASILSNNGKSVCIIEKSENTMGGTCLNEGCIPAKNFLETSSYIKKNEYFKSCGVNFNLESFNIETLKKSTNCLIQDLKVGILSKLKKSKASIIYGKASFINENTIKINNKQISSKDIIIASGSIHKNHPLLPLVDNKIISSKEVFTLNEIPKSILIIGGGAIGCEFASFFNALGVRVEIAEFTSKLVFNEDDDISRTLKRELEKKGIKIYLNANVNEYEILHNEVEVNIQSSKNKQKKTYEKILISIGRAANTNNLDLNNANITLNKGYIEVNDNLQCINTSNIYAIGDVISSPALAHVAYYEAKRVAKIILKQDAIPKFAIYPSVTFCTPQIASIGKNEKYLKDNNIDFKVKKLFFKSNAKAKIKGDDSGFVKVLYNEQSKTIFGASIIGNDATELIHQFLIAINANLTLNDIEKMIFAHPTLSESTLDLLH